jgi:serine/threonine protein phosphatase PrpC
MAAASVNHVVAAKVVLEESPESVNEVDLQGRTALHIAAELGCVEMVEFLKTMHPEGPDAPLDLTGHTPFGRAVTSHHKEAKKHQSQLQEKLFSPGDVSVCGRPTPAKTRSAELDLQLIYGYAEMPGFRVMMEDAISCHVWPGHALLGVCDGHGDGGLVSDFVSSEIANILKNQLAGCPDDVNAVWTTSCLSLDEKLKQTGRKGGSTAVWALVTAASVIVANVGDSRCILIHKRGVEQAMEQLTLDDGMVEEREAVAGEQCASDEKNIAEQNDDEQGNEVGSTSPEAMQPPAVKVEKEKSFVVTALSEDHKPNLEEERARIENSGLAVSSETFMMGEKECTVHKVALSETDRLAVSRAFGDFEYKANEELPASDQAVVAIPEIHVHHRDESRDMYLVLACDGVWDVMSNEEVGDFVVRHVEEAISEGATDILPRVGDMLVNECLRRGSTDNMSAMVVALSKEAARLSGSPIMKGKALKFLD